MSAGMPEISSTRTKPMLGWSGYVRNYVFKQLQQMVKVLTLSCMTLSIISSTRLCMENTSARCPSALMLSSSSTRKTIFPLSATSWSTGSMLILCTAGCSPISSGSSSTSSKLQIDHTSQYSRTYRSPLAHSCLNCLTLIFGMRVDLDPGKGRRSKVKVKQ